MELILIGGCFALVVFLYFSHNPMKHGTWFMIRRFINWFPLGMTYSFLYFGRYNLNVSKNALGSLMTKEDFGIIFAVGTTVYALSFLINGPLVDKIGGKKGIIIAAAGACVANILMGVATYVFLSGYYSINLVITLSLLYGLNMYFQSYGAVSIIKVKAYWFHVRERGIFGAIFGTLISFGVYFAFDWGQSIVDSTKVAVTGELTYVQRILRTLVGADTATIDPTWYVFFIPGICLIFWIIMDLICIKDTPSQANFQDFDTHDASSGEMDKEFSFSDLLKRIFTSPIMLILAAVEFCSGVIRNGIMQWYFIFAKEVPQIGAEFFFQHWGLLTCFTGIIGSFAAGFISDKLFQSRRGPPVAIFGFLMFLAITTMAFVLYSSPLVVGLCATLVLTVVIGVHSLMSGTAAADFGGRKATGTASGIVDGFVYLGSGLQSLSLGYITSWNWQFWPIFLAPFALLGTLFAIKIWKALPTATKKYLQDVEKIDSNFHKLQKDLKS